MGCLPIGRARFQLLGTSLGVSPISRTYMYAHEWDTYDDAWETSHEIENIGEIA